MRSVSVVVPTYNRVKLLPYLLNSCLKQACIKEIIVVDDGSTENYGLVIEKYKSFFSQNGVTLKYVRHPLKRGSGAARNTGVKLSTQQYIMMSDDDVVFPPNAICDLLSYMKSLKADVVGARLIPATLLENEVLPDPTYQSITGTFIDWKTLQARYYIDTKNPIETPFVSSVSLWKKKLFDTGVKYDERFKGNGYREETSASIIAKIKGASIWYVPSVIAYHISSNNSGGQWEMSKLRWYMWSLRNNWLFLREYYPQLRRMYTIGTPLWLSQLLFAVRLSSLFIPKHVKHWLRRL